jgi:hypothetical protein
VVAVAALAAAAITWQSIGRGDDRPSSVDKQSSAAVAGPAAPRHVPESAFAAQPPFKGAAVKQFGQAALQAAYRQVVNFAFDTGWDPVLIAQRRSALTRADFDRPRSSLTVPCAKTYDALVKKALSGDRAAIRDLEGAALFSVAGTNSEVRALTGEAAVSDRRFSRATMTLDRSSGKARLAVTFTATALVHLRDAAGKKFVMQTARELNYRLVRNAAADVKGRAFLIDAWSNHLQTKAPRAA